MQVDIPFDRYIGNLSDLIASGSIKATAKLTMPAFDVDYNAVVQAPNDPERDVVSINGHVMPSQYLTGEDRVWKVNLFEFPVEWLLVPESSPGKGGQVQPVINQLNIDIDVDNIDIGEERWCTSLDWVMLEIEVERPVVMVHGILSSGSTWDGLPWTQNLSTMGIPYSNELNMGNLDSISNNAAKIKNHVAELKTRWGVQKVNIVAHSKGGIDARDFVESNDDVEHLFQLGTPNAGSPLADIAQSVVIGAGGLGAFRFGTLAAPAGVQLTTPYMTLYNQFHSNNASVDYTSVAGNYDALSVFSLDSFLNAILPGDDDTIVTKNSVWALNYANKFVVSSAGNNIEAKHTGQTRSNQIFELWLNAHGGPSTLAKPANTVALNKKLRPSSSINSSNVAAVQSLLSTSTSDGGVIKQSEEMAHTFVVEDAGTVYFLVSYPEGDLQVTLVDPDSEVISAENYTSKVGVSYAVGSDTFDSRYVSYEVTNAKAGQWTVRLMGDTVTYEDGIMYSATAFEPTSDIAMSVGAKETVNIITDELVVFSEIKNGALAIQDATVQATALDPQDNTLQFNLLDNGVSPDEVAGDGIYTGGLTGLDIAGDYRINILAQGAQNSFRRSGFIAVTVTQSLVTVDSSGITESTVLDDNFVIEQLYLNIPIASTQDGTYRLIGTLRASDGTELETSVSQISLTANVTALASMSYDGFILYSAGLDGPYQLSELKIIWLNDDVIEPVVDLNNVYTTNAYDYTDFTRPDIFVSNTGSDETVDSDGDEIIDHLVIKLDVAVIASDFYSYSANLEDFLGNEIGFAFGSGTLAAGQNQVTLTFDGQGIGENGVSGPYKLTGMLMFSNAASITMDNVYLTGFYDVVNFTGYTPALQSIETLTPNSVREGSQSIEITVKGNDFASGSLIVWQNKVLATEFISDTQLTAFIAGSDLIESGQYSVTVYTPGTNGGLSQPAVFTVTSNQAPQAVQDSVVLDEDSSASFLPLENDSDPENDTIVLVTIAKPANGSLSVDSGVFTYTPSSDFYGTDSVNYSISDIFGAQSTSTVTFTVNPVADMPQATDDGITTAEDTAVSISILDNDFDVDGDVISIVNITSPTSGTATLNADMLTYIPNADFFGNDSLNYTISDGNGGEATAMVNVTVTSVNDLPIANNDAVQTQEDQAVTIGVTNNDSDIEGDVVLLSVEDPDNGTISIDGNNVVYTPAANYFGDDSFGYIIADAHGSEASAMVTLFVTSVNDLPVASNDAGQTEQEQSITIEVTANDSDVEGPVTLSSVTVPANGNAVIDGDNVVYTPKADFSGSDEFSYVIVDGDGAEATAIVAVTVNARNNGSGGGSLSILLLLTLMLPFRLIRLRS